jgi:hypothetical protein
MTILNKETAISVGLVITIMTVAFGGGSLYTTVCNHAERLSNLENKQTDYPTRREFEELKISIKEWKDDIKLDLKNISFLIQK